MAPQLLPVLLLLVCTATHSFSSYCVDEIPSCPIIGYLPRCSDFCDTRFFSCDLLFQPGVLFSCFFGTVFEMDPFDPYNANCVLFEDCSLASGDCVAYGPPRCGNQFEMIPRCPYCDPSYYICSPNDPDGLADEVSCGSGMMFNPIPSLPGCIPENECPRTNSSG